MENLIQNDKLEAQELSFEEMEVIIGGKYGIDLYKWYCVSLAGQIAQSTAPDPFDSLVSFYVEFCA